MDCSCPCTCNEDGIAEGSCGACLGICADTTACRDAMGEAPCDPRYDTYVEQEEAWKRNGIDGAFS